VQALLAEETADETADEFELAGLAVRRDRQPMPGVAAAS
jgi:hypothetical protein